MGIGLVPQKTLFIMKKLLMYLLLLLPLAMASCGGDDKDEPNIGDNTSNTSESTDYLASSQVKTLTIELGKEYMIFKDFYYKHKICLNSASLEINTYHGGGNGWTLDNGSSYVGIWLGYSGITLLSEMSGINEITNYKIVYGDYGQGSYIAHFFHSETKRNCYPYVQFKPNYGYEVAFRTGAENNIQHMKLYPTSYKLNNNDQLVSVTIQYQLF